MNPGNFQQLEKLFLALADHTRLRLLALMAGGEVSVGFLAGQLGESQPKISRHLAYLRSAALVSTRREGKRIYYGIEWQDKESVASVLNAVLESMSARGSVESTMTTNLHSGNLPHTEPDKSVDSFIDDWTPNEMETFLL